jgi:hypothetical protein
MKKNPLREKSFAIALRIVKLAQYLNQEKRDLCCLNSYCRAEQRSGGWCVRSNKGRAVLILYIKLVIALKEADEIQYWLELLHQTDYIDARGFDSIKQDCIELLKLLTAIIKSTKSNP